MKTYTLSDRKDAFGICNYDRIDEGILFNKVIKAIESKGAKLKRTEGPSENVVTGSWDGVEFYVFYDIDYELTTVVCNDDSVLARLKWAVEES